MIKRLSCVLAGAPLLFPGAAIGQSPAPSEPVYYSGPHMWWGWEGAFFGPLFMIIVIVGVVAAIALLLRRPTGVSSSLPPGPTPLDILKMRFARGEIDNADYEERRRVLGE